MNGKRKLSPDPDDEMAYSKQFNVEKRHASAQSSFSDTIKGFFESIAGNASNSANPVINGATVKSKPLLARVIADLASQAPRLGENAALFQSLIDTKLFDGGLVDDRQYQVSLRTMTSRTRC